jgi:hypothetical protein
MSKWTALPRFFRTKKSEISVSEYDTYNVYHNILLPNESSLWITIKNRLKRSPSSNRLQTTRYNIITFIPKNLFDQFHRAGNIFFAIIVGLNYVPLLEIVSKNVCTHLIFANFYFFLFRLPLYH